MPIAAKSALFLVSFKAIALAAVATQYDPMEEPVPYIFAAVLALAALSLKTRRAWWYAFLVEVLTLAGACATVGEQSSRGSSAQKFMVAAGTVALLAFVGLVLMLRRSTRDWYKSRKTASS